MSHLKIYQSSAGSGKTYTLVKEYLLLVLKKPSLLRSTLAVTFTNDATGEMKERVVKALWELSAEKNEILKKDLLKELGNSFNINQAAEEVLRHILHHYSELSIQTIDSFFLNITRSVAYETGLSGRYNVELNHEAAIDFITSGVLLAAGENKELTDWLIEFAIYRMDNEKGWDMQQAIKDSSKNLFNDDIKRQLQFFTMDADLIRKIYDNVKRFRTTLQEMSSCVFDMLGSAGATVDDVYYKSNGFIGTLKKLKEKSDLKNYEFGKRFLDACEYGMIFSKNGDSRYDYHPDLKKDIQQKLQEIREYYVTGLDEFITSEVVCKNIYLKGLLGFLNQQLAVYRKENKVILISDVGDILRNFISDNDTPFIYEKAGNAYRNFLIDEFQDTSETQWNNMLPLLINSLSQNNQVLTVGDVKQSIYRWRGGNMQLLMTEVKDKLESHTAKMQELNLTTNYRSTETVISFNNKLFGSAYEIFNDNQEYNELVRKAFHQDQVVQKVSRNHLKGYVQIEIYDEGDELTADYKYPDYSSDAEKCILEKTMKYIQEQLQKGFTYGDIALLVRENRKGALLADFLVLNGITQINSRDSLLITNAPQIRFLINAFSFIADIGNYVAEKHIRWYASKILGFKIEELDESFFRGVKRFRQMSLTEAGASLIHLFGLNRTPDGYIQSFEDLLLEKSSKGLWDIQLFLEWWNVEKERLKVSVKLPSDTNSITIMTIHGSKGLQFPIVILPFLDFELAKSKGTIWVETTVEPFNKLGLVPVDNTKKLEYSYFNEAYQKERQERQLDELNSFYVACTRAEEKLLMLVDIKSGSGLTSIGDFVRFSLNKEDSLKLQMEEKSERLFASGEDAKKLTRVKKVKNEPDTFEVNTLKKYLINESGVHKGFKIRKNIAEDEQRKFGICLHDFMASYYSPSDESRIKLQIEASPLAESTKKQLKKNAERAFELINDHGWISEKYKVLNETEICDAEGNIFRPDRLMMNENNAVVLDYKTGQPSSDHHQQMINYKSALKQSGFANTEAFLYYLETGELVAV